MENTHTHKKLATQGFISVLMAVLFLAPLAELSVHPLAIGINTCIVMALIYHASGSWSIFNPREVPMGRSPP